MQKDFDNQEVRLGQGVNSISLELQNSALSQTNSIKMDARRVDAKFFTSRTIREMHENFDASLAIKGPQVVPGIKANLSVIKNKYQYDLYSAVALTCTEFVQVLDEGYTLNQTARALIGATKPIRPEEQIITTQLGLVSQTEQQLAALQQSLAAQHTAAVQATQLALAAQQTLADQLAAVSKPFFDAEQALLTQQTAVLQAEQALKKAREDVDSNTKAVADALVKDKVLADAKQAVTLQQVKIDGSNATLQQAQADLAPLKKALDDAIAADKLYHTDESRAAVAAAQQRYDAQQAIVTTAIQVYLKNVTDMLPLTKAVDDATSKNKTLTDAQAALASANAKIAPLTKALSDARDTAQILVDQTKKVESRVTPMRNQVAAQQVTAAETVAKALATQQILADQLNDAAKSAREAQRNLEAHKAHVVTFDHNDGALNRFASAYGDAFVDRITYGRWAFIVIQFHLQTQDQQTRVGLQLSGIGGGLPGGVSVDASFSNQLSRALNNLDYTINIFSGGIDQPAIGLLSSEADLNKLLSTFTIEGPKSNPTQLDWTYQPYAKAGVTESSKAVAQSQGGASSSTSTTPQVPAPLYGNEDDQYLKNLGLFHSTTEYARTVNRKLIEIREYLKAQLESLDLPQIDSLLLDALTSTAVQGPPAVAGQDAVPPAGGDPGQAAIPPIPAYILVDDVDATVDNVNFNAEGQIALLGSSIRHRPLIPLRNSIYLIRALLPIVADMQKLLADKITDHGEISNIATKTNQLLKFHVNKLHQVVSAIYLLNDRVWIPVKRVANHQITGPGLIHKKLKHKKEEYSFDLDLPEHTDALTFDLRVDANHVLAPVKFKKHDLKPKLNFSILPKERAKDQSPYGASTVNGNYNLKQRTLVKDISRTPVYPVTETMNHLYFKKTTNDQNGQYDVSILAHCGLFRPKNRDMPLSLAVRDEPAGVFAQVPLPIQDQRLRALIGEVLAEQRDEAAGEIGGGVPLLIPAAVPAVVPPARYTNIAAQVQAHEILESEFRFKK